MLLCKSQTQDLTQGVETISTCEHLSSECTGYHPRPGVLHCLSQAEKSMLAEVPITPLLQYANVQLIRPYVEGLQPDPLDVVGWAGILK